MRGESEVKRSEAECRRGEEEKRRSAEEIWRADDRNMRKREFVRDKTEICALLICIQT